MTNVQCNHLMATIWHLKNKIQFFKLKKCAESKAQKHTLRSAKKFREI